MYNTPRIENMDENKTFDVEAEHRIIQALLDEADAEEQRVIRLACMYVGAFVGMLFGDASTTAMLLWTGLGTLVGYVASAAAIFLMY